MTKISNNKPVSDFEERTFSLRVGTKAVRLYSLGHWDLEFGIYLEFDAWDFPDFNKPATLFIPCKNLFK